MSCFAPSLAIEVVEEPTQFAEVLVPEEAFRINSSGHQYVQTFSRVLASITAIALEESRRRNMNRFFLSRSRLGSRPRSTAASKVEAFFRSQGFGVIHPEAMELPQQIELIKNAREIAGFDGSAMHLVAFASDRLRGICFDTRQVVNQFIVEELSGVKLTHIDVRTLEPGPDSRLNSRLQELMVTLRSR